MRTVQDFLFRVVPFPKGNDSETKILIEGEDVVSAHGGMGLDPPDLFSQQQLLAGGEALIGRCTCGVIGCGPVYTDIAIGDDYAEWRGDVGEYRFPIEAYRQWIRLGTSDHSWEDVKRRAERLVNAALSGLVLDDGWVFEWASARMRAGVMCLSFVKDGVQSLRALSWDGEDAAAVVRAAQALRDEVEEGRG